MSSFHRYTSASLSSRCCCFVPAHRPKNGKPLHRMSQSFPVPAAVDMPFRSADPPDPSQMDTLLSIHPTLRSHRKQNLRSDKPLSALLRQLLLHILSHCPWKLSWMQSNTLPQIFSFKTSSFFPMFWSDQKICFFLLNYFYYSGIPQTEQDKIHHSCVFFNPFFNYLSTICSFLAKTYTTST